jgi:hypothetical protein
MKRLGRWVFGISAALSFTLLGATTVFWVWSGLHPWHPILSMRGIPLEYPYLSIEGASGLIIYQGPPGTPPLLWSYVAGRGARATPLWNGYRTGPSTLYFAFWKVVLALAALPAMWLISRFRLDRSVAEGYCKKCGYDLRATPNRCPECGSVPERISFSS